MSGVPALTSFDFHHVGVGTRDFDGAIATYRALGHRLHSRVDDPVLDVRVAFLRAPGESGPWIEILAPLGPNGALKSLLARKSLPTPYHTCYVVPDLAGAASHLRELEFLPLGDPAPAIAFGGQPVAFFSSLTVGMIELVQAPATLPALGLSV